MMSSPSNRAILSESICSCVSRFSKVRTEESQSDIAKRALALKQSTATALPVGKSAYTLAELTEMGDGCRSYLYAEIAAKRLRAVKRGRRLVVLAEDREAWRSKWPAATIKLSLRKQQHDQAAA